MKKLNIFLVLIACMCFGHSANAQLKKVKNSTQLQFEQEQQPTLGQQINQKKTHHQEGMQCTCDKHSEDHPSHNGKGMKKGHHNCDKEHSDEIKSKKEKKKSKSKKKNKTNRQRKNSEQSMILL